jgi:hypothetical protein
MPKSAKWGPRGVFKRQSISFCGGARARTPTLLNFGAKCRFALAFPRLRRRIRCRSWRRHRVRQSSLASFASWSDICTLPIGSFGARLPAITALQQSTQPVPHDVAVIRDEDTDGRLSSHAPTAVTLIVRVTASSSYPYSLSGRFRGRLMYSAGAEVRGWQQGKVKVEWDYNHSPAHLRCSLA